MLNRLQILRGFAALAVVFSHFEHWNNLESGGYTKKVFVLYIGSFAVHTFFVISGFIIRYSHRQEIGERRNLGIYLIKRGFRIYPAYWLFSVINMVLGWFAYSTWDHTGSLRRSIAEFASAFTLVPFANNQYCSFIGVGWSLFYEVVFYILFSLLFIGKRIGYAVMFGYSLLCISHVFLKLDLFWISKLGILFYIGYGIAVAVEKIRLPVAYSRLLVAAGVALYAAAVLVCANQPGLGMVISTISATMLVTGTVNMDLARPVVRRGIWVSGLVWLGSISYSLYLCHTVVGSIIFNYFGTPRSSILVGSLYVVGPVLVASVSYIYVEKYCQRLGRKLCTRLAGSC